MILAPNNRYQLKVDLANTIQDQLNCEQFISDTINFSGFVKCKVVSKVIEIFFNPPEEINDEYIFAQIDSLLKEIGIVFLKATLRQYVGNLTRTAVASAAGGALGARAGPIGALLGVLAGATVEKALFDWKDLCGCTHDEVGNLNITNYSN